MRAGVRRLLWIVVLAGVHSAVTFSLLLFAFGEAMARFDSGAPVPFAAQVAGGAVRVLAFPLLSLVQVLPRSVQPRGFPWEHLLFLCNSVIWAIVAMAFWKWLVVSLPTSSADRQAAP